MSRRFIISDQHFWHEKAILYNARPFSSVEEMNRKMIINHNNVVKNRDVCFFLGDFSFCPNDMTREVYEQLNGTKILILGNHDRRKSVTWWRRAGFEEIHKYPLIINDRFILSHEPVEGDLGKFYNIHGHIHLNRSDVTTDRHVNVCVETTGYCPVNLDQLMDFILKG